MLHNALYHAVRAPLQCADPQRVYYLLYYYSQPLEHPFYFDYWSVEGKGAG